MKKEDGLVFVAGNERAELEALREFVALAEVWQWPLSATCSVEIRIRGGQRPNLRELQTLRKYIDALTDAVTDEVPSSPQQ